jgi:hypothetical protein
VDFPRRASSAVDRAGASGRRKSLDESRRALNCGRTEDDHAMRLSKRRLPEAECRGGAKGFPWRSCRARPSEGRQPKPIWPSGGNSETSQRPISFAEGCAPRVREDVSVECRGPFVRSGQRRWPEAECRGGAKGFPWRSCRARPSEGRQPKPILPSGDNSETSQRPSLRRDALRASVKMCWSDAEAHLCGRAKGGGQRGKCHNRARAFLGGRAEPDPPRGVGVLVVTKNVTWVTQNVTGPPSHRPDPASPTCISGIGNLSPKVWLPRS